MRDGLRDSRVAWYASPLVAIPIAAALTSLDAMLEWGPWWRTAGLYAAGLVAAVSLTRALSRSRLLPTVTGLVVAIWVALPMFTRSDEGSRLFLPTPGALRQLGEIAAQGLDDAARSTAPAAVTPGLLVLVLGAFAGLFLLADHLAVSWRAAATTGLVLLVPWMPAIALGHRVPVTALLIALGAWILLLALTRRHTGAGRRPAPLAGIAASVAAIALVAGVAPAALGSNGWGLIPRLAAPDNLDVTTRLNLELDLRNSLTLDSASPIMLYASSGERPDAFKLYTLAEFDGAEWSRGEEAMPEEPVSGVLWSSAPLDWDTRRLDRVSVQILSLAETNLPLPPVPRVVDVSGDWKYSSSLDEVASETVTTQDVAYSFDADLTYFDADLLKAAGAADGEDALLDPRYLQLPASADSAALTALAQQLTAGADSRYDQALALQEYFRTESLFTYDTSVAPEGDDYVSVFLDKKSGYCVQFATAMVMLARTLDIPARLAVGFLPGQDDGTGAYVIRGGDAHAWPEVYFEGLGWVRFEPTPSLQTGPRPAYADPLGENLPEPTQGGEVPVVEPSATSAPETTAAPTTSAPSPGDVTDEEPAATPWPLIAGAVALTVIAALAIAWWRRRFATIARAATVETAWETLRDGLGDHGWPLTLTPFEAAQAVRGSFTDAGLPVADDALRELDALAAEVSDARYSPDGPAATGMEATQRSRSILAAVAAAKESVRSRPARAGARDAPRRDA